MAKVTTGNPTEYSDGDHATIEAAIDDGWASYDDKGGRWEPGSGPSSITVESDIEWAGVSTGRRRTTLDQLDVDEIERMARSRANDRKGWEAQLRALTAAGDRGSAATDRVNLNPTRRTFTQWITGDRTPTARNRALIGEAYRDMRNERRGSDGSRLAPGAMASALSETIKARYGSEVRFFGRTTIRFHD